MIAHKKLADLHEFARKYAHACRSPVIEIEDAVQEMLVIAMVCPHKSPEYVRQAMKYRYLDLIRRGYWERKRRVPLTEEIDIPEDVDGRWESTNKVDIFFGLLSRRENSVMKDLLAGLTVDAIADKYKLTPRTIYRSVVLSGKLWDSLLDC